MDEQFLRREIEKYQKIYKDINQDNQGLVDGIKAVKNQIRKTKIIADE